MSTSAQHVYEITDIFCGDEHLSEFGRAEIGSYVRATGHVRKYHEPERQFEYLNVSKSVGSKNAFTVIAAKHIGEYEKVKDYLGQKGGGGMTIFDYDEDIQTNRLHFPELRRLPSVEWWERPGGAPEVYRDCFICGAHVGREDEVTPLIGGNRRIHHSWCWETARVRLWRAVER